MGHDIDMSNQPVWSRLVIDNDPDSGIFVDQTGVYDPELEVTQYVGGQKTARFRFALEKHKEVTVEGHTYIVPDSYDTSWPYHASQYIPWWYKDLGSVARFIGLDRLTLLSYALSEEPTDRKVFYMAIGDYHGYLNLDSYPTLA